MKLTGNTIFITGGGSGIGRALAEELHKRGNKVIISGRRKGHLAAVVTANPGIDAMALDIADPDNINNVAKKLIQEYPDLNVLINNAGIMEPDQAAGVIDDGLLLSTVTTNLLGPIRLTSGLVDQLKSRRGVILYNTSVLGFVPLAVTAVYSATKAALHSYALSQRFLLRDSGVRVLEMAPPWVRTELMNSQEAFAVFRASVFPGWQHWPPPPKRKDRARGRANFVDRNHFVWIEKRRERVPGRRWNPSNVFLISTNAIRRLCQQR